ncbi:MAG: phosphotriesterase, partial [Chitinophagaceae bacterium]|nr:phosphotriesterase [Chitinophagaceae bacterium]
ITTDFIGAEKIIQPPYNSDSAYNTILPFLVRLKEQGIKSFFECTPNYIGRDVKLLRRLSEASGINIITNTGYYAAVEKKYLPKHVYEESVEQLAQRWLNEWRNGIDGTAIRPGFIKLGVGEGAIDSIETKLILAAINVHKQTGLTIAIHTGNGDAALSEYELFKNEGISGENLIWVHAQNGKAQEHISLAKNGVWLSFDGISEPKIKEYVTYLKNMKAEGLLSRVLISHDDGWSVENENDKIKLLHFDNGNKIPYTTIFDRFIKALEREGFTKEEIDTILVENPRKAFEIK